MVSLAVDNLSRFLLISRYQLPSIFPKNVSSAKTPCVLPIIFVLCSSIALFLISFNRSSTSFNKTSRDSLIKRLLDVSTTSELVSP